MEILARYQQICEIRVYLIRAIRGKQKLSHILLRPYNKGNQLLQGNADPGNTVMDILTAYLRCKGW